MPIVNIYLNFNGNCAEAFDFYKAGFGGEFSYVGKFGEMPPQEGMPPLPDDMKDKIMHIGLPISKETTLMGSDTSEAFGGKAVVGNNFSISISTGSKEEADRLFNALSAGGKVTMPLDQTFWSPYFGMFTDKFGVNWMVDMATDQEG